MTTSAKTSAKKMLMSDLMQTVGILPILILIVAVFGFIAPNFFTESNLLNITRQASINIVLAAGMTFIILTGGIDLSVGSIINVGQEPLVFRRAGFSPALSLLMSAFALLIPPAYLTAHLRRLTERSPTQQHTVSLPQLRCMV